MATWSQLCLLLRKSEIGRQGNPLQSLKRFATQDKSPKPMLDQILTHLIWWREKSMNVEARLRLFYLTVTHRMDEEDRNVCEVWLLEKILEVLRRLTVVSVYIGGLFLTGIMIDDTYSRHGLYGNSAETLRYSAVVVGILIAMPIVHRLINWVLLKDEKKPTSD